MLIVAIAWIYVVGLMAITEPTVVAGIMTFLLYCVLPLGTLIYLSGTRKRKARRDAAWLAAHQARQAAQAAANPGAPAENPVENSAAKPDVDTPTTASEPAAPKG
jgi:hypothetical protein